MYSVGNPNRIFFVAVGILSWFPQCINMPVCEPRIVLILRFLFHVCPPYNKCMCDWSSRNWCVKPFHHNMCFKPEVFPIIRFPAMIESLALLTTLFMCRFNVSSQYKCTPRYLTYTNLILNRSCLDKNCGCLRSLMWRSWRYTSEISSLFHKEEAGRRETGRRKTV